MTLCDSIDRFKLRGSQAFALILVVIVGATLTGCSGPTTDDSQGTLTGHNHWINSLAFSKNGELLASASRDKTVRIWSIPGGDPIMTYRQHNRPVRAVAFSSTGRHVASAAGTDIHVWDYESGNTESILSDHETDVTSIVYNPATDELLSASEDGLIFAWGEDRTLRWERKHPERSATCLSVSSDGRYLASGGTDGTIVLWDAENGRELKRLEGHSHWVRSLAFADRNQALLSVGADETVRRWNINTGQQDWVKNRSTPLRAVSSSSDGKLFASSGVNAIISVGETKSGAEIVALQGHRKTVRALAFHDDGKFFVSAGGDEIKIWKLP